MWTNKLQQTDHIYQSHVIQPGVLFIRYTWFPFYKKKNFFTYVLQNKIKLNFYKFLQ